MRHKEQRGSGSVLIDVMMTSLQAQMKHFNEYHRKMEIEMKLMREKNLLLVYSQEIPAMV